MRPGIQDTYTRTYQSLIAVAVGIPGHVTTMFTTPNTYQTRPVRCSRTVILFQLSRKSVNRAKTEGKAKGGGVSPLMGLGAKSVDRTERVMYTARLACEVPLAAALVLLEVDAGNHGSHVHLLAVHRPRLERQRTALRVEREPRHVHRTVR